jgi:L-rhamnonate dehydratase
MTHAVTITAVEIRSVRGPEPEPTLPYQQRRPNMLHLYPEHRPPRLVADGAAVPGSAEALYLRIGTDAGAEGFYGPIDPAATWPILQMLGPFLIGQDALAGTILWDKLERLDRHARHGHLKMAISALDNALWDLRGKVFEAPVWQLLGGGSRSRIPAYASMLGTSLAPDSIAAAAAARKTEGFTGQKWFLADGPGSGSAGLDRDVRVTEQIRDVLGPEHELMIDVFQEWDLSFARAWAERVRDVNITWLEEPFQPGKYPAFVELHRSTGIPLSAGEHLYDRAEVLPYLRDGVLAVVQSDPEWCGGVTELVRICALADTFGVPVIPHGHGLHAALHVVASQSPATCPKVEYLVNWIDTKHHFELNPPRPSRGSFDLPEADGFGIELDDSKIEASELVQFR